MALAGASPVWQGLVGGVVITLMSTIGALLVLVWRRPSERFLDAALGFAAGVMLTASFTSLILPGIEHGGIWPVLIGIAAGAMPYVISDEIVPETHRKGHERIATFGIILGVIVLLYRDIALTEHSSLVQDTSPNFRKGWAAYSEFGLITTLKQNARGRGLGKPRTGAAVNILQPIDPTPP